MISLSKSRIRHGSVLARIGAGAGLVALGCALSLARQRGPGALDTVWAEDGSIFLQAALADASPQGWLDSYGGYLHLVPRILASITAILPLDWAPVLLSGGAALAAAGLAMIAYRAAETHVPGRGDRTALAVCLLASPSAGIEVANAAANIHWYLPYAIGWLALWRPAGRLEAAIGGTILFLAATSHPFAMLAAPFLAWRLIRAPRSTDVLWAVALGAGLALQAWTILSNGGSRPLNPFATSAATLAQWYGFHVLETAVFGIRLRDVVVNALGVVGSAALAVAILAFLIAPVVFAARRRPFVPLVLVSLHLGFYFMPVALAGTSPARYAITPILLLYALIAWGLATQSRERSRLPRWVAGALLAAVTIADFAPTNLRSEGPRWSHELSRARTVCETGNAVAATATIPPRGVRLGAPEGSVEPWTVVIPCEISALPSYSHERRVPPLSRRRAY
jgi:hypothetical protein